MLNIATPSLYAYLMQKPRSLADTIPIFKILVLIFLSALIAKLGRPLLFACLVLFFNFFHSLPSELL